MSYLLIGIGKFVVQRLLARWRLKKTSCHLQVRIMLTFIIQFPFEIGSALLSNCPYGLVHVRVSLCAHHTRVLAYYNFRPTSNAAKFLGVYEHRGCKWRENVRAYTVRACARNLIDEISDGTDFRAKAGKPSSSPIAKRKINYLLYSTQVVAYVYVRIPCHYIYRHAKLRRKYFIPSCSIQIICTYANK